MKRIIFPILVMILGYATEAAAQTGKNKNKQQPVKKQVAKTEGTEKGKQDSEMVSLTSVSAGQAFGNRPASRFSIADPTINLLNQRAGGSNAPISNSGIVGMPKRAYGFANGKILLRNTTAPSSGTMYGSGSVGTGTTISGVGISENVIGVNGKNPYAGPSLWGSKMTASGIASTDSGRKQ